MPPPAPAPAGLRRPHAPHPRRMLATRGPPAGSPAAAGSSRKSPAPASKRLGPPGRGSPSRPRGGVRDRPLGGQAGPGGASHVDGAGPAPRPCQDGAHPARAPQPLPCARRCSRRISATGAHTAPPWTSRRVPPARLPARANPRRRLPGCAGPPRWWCRTGRRQPTRTPGRTPAAQSPRAGPGQARASGVNRIAHRLSSSGRFPGAGMILIPSWIQTLHHTQNDPPPE